MKFRVFKFWWQPLRDLNHNDHVPVPVIGVTVTQSLSHGLRKSIIIHKILLFAIPPINETSEKYNESHPSILKQITNITKTCRKLNIETSITGKTIFEPIFVEFLVKNGVDSLICNVNSVNDAKNKIDVAKPGTQKI